MKLSARPNGKDIDGLASAAPTLLIKQRWLVVESAARKEADLNHLEQKIKQHFEKAQKQLAHLSQHDYACEPDALAAAEQWNQKLRYHHLSQIEVVAYPYYSKPGRPMC